MDTVFKTPVANPTAIGATPEPITPPDTITEAPSPLRVNTNPSLDEVRASGEPYANTVLKTETPYNFLPSKTQSDLKEIDKFVDDQISEKGWLHNVTAYNKVMDELSFELGLGEEGISDRIARIASYARSMNKLQGIDEVKRKLNHKLKSMRDPRDMDRMILKEVGRLIV